MSWRPTRPRRLAAARNSGRARQRQSGKRHADVGRVELAGHHQLWSGHRRDGVVQHRPATRCSRAGCRRTPSRPRSSASAGSGWACPGWRSSGESATGLEQIVIEAEVSDTAQLPAHHVRLAHPRHTGAAATTAVPGRGTASSGSCFASRVRACRTSLAMSADWRDNPPERTLPCTGSPTCVRDVR